MALLLIFMCAKRCDDCLTVDENRLSCTEFTVGNLMDFIIYLFISFFVFFCIGFIIKSLTVHNVYVTLRVLQNASISI